MLQNELKAMLNEEECIGVPADEEYQEYLIDYILDENLFENELSDYCVFPIGYNQSIIYIKFSAAWLSRGRDTSSDY